MEEKRAYGVTHIGLPAQRKGGNAMPK